MRARTRGAPHPRPRAPCLLLLAHKDMMIPLGFSNLKAALDRPPRTNAGWRAPPRITNSVKPPSAKTFGTHHYSRRTPCPISVSPRTRLAPPLLFSGKTPHKTAAIDHLQRQGVVPANLLIFHHHRRIALLAVAHHQRLVPALAQERQPNLHALAPASGRPPQPYYQPAPPKQAPGRSTRKNPYHGS